MYRGRTETGVEGWSAPPLPGEEHTHGYTLSQPRDIDDDLCTPVRVHVGISMPQRPSLGVIPAVCPMGGWSAPPLHPWYARQERCHMTTKKKTISRPVHFETTIPVIRPCTRCGVWFAAGVAEGLRAEVEFVPLDHGQALWAVLNQIELYCIRRSGLVHMDALRMSGRYLGRLYPQHRCDIKWPTVLGEVQKSSLNLIPPY